MGILSAIHTLGIWTAISMVIAVLSVNKGYVRIHAAFMAGTIIGVVTTGVFAIMSGRSVSAMIGYA